MTIGWLLFKLKGVFKYDKFISLSGNQGISDVTELCDLSATELRRRLAERTISPMEVVEDCLARIAAVNPAVNAVVTLDEDGARVAARAAEAAILRGEPLGPLQ